MNTRFSALLLAAVLPGMAAAQDPKAAVTPGQARIANGRVSADIVLTLDGTTLVDFDMHESAIEQFAGDTGDNLGAKPPGPPNYETMPIYESSSSSGDKNMRTITLASP